MQRLNDKLVFSPTDLNNFLDCEFLTRLDIEVANGRVLQTVRNPEADLLAAKGEAHELRFLEQFERERGSVARIESTSPVHDWNAAARATRDAMASGAPVIYQATLTMAGWRGKADFLVRVDAPSALGDWSYEAGTPSSPDTRSQSTCCNSRTTATASRTFRVTRLCRCTSSSARARSSVIG